MAVPIKLNRLDLSAAKDRYTDHSLDGVVSNVEGTMSVARLLKAYMGRKSICLLIVLVAFAFALYTRPLTNGIITVFNRPFAASSLRTKSESSDIPTSTQSSDVIEDSTPGTDSNEAVASALFKPDAAKFPLIAERFAQRMKRFKRYCRKPEYRNMKIERRKRNIYMRVAHGRLQWCLIPKIGTTHLHKLERESLRQLERVKQEDSKTPHVFFVREPYSRMISGYLGKLVTNEPWWKSFGRHIIKNFRNNPSQRAKECGSDVTFPEFVKYFIHSQETGLMKNTHFLPIHEQCHMCEREYDFIGHLETFPDDVSYILHSVNVSLALQLSNDEATLIGKAQSIIYQRSRIKKCEDMCVVLKRTWWTFQARGLISNDISMPLTHDQCNIISADQFAEVALKAHRISTGQMNKSKQKRDALVELYLQVPLDDRLKVRKLLAKDFELFDYDPEPADIFPELQDKSSH